MREQHFELHLKFVSLTASRLFVTTRRRIEQPLRDVKRALRVVVTPPDGGKAIQHLWKGENLLQKLRKLFEDRKYDSDNLVLQFYDDSAQLPKHIPTEYFIVDEALVVEVQLIFGDKKFVYFARSAAQATTIIERAISDRELRTASDELYLCFFNAFGQAIDNETVIELIDLTANPDEKSAFVCISEERNSPQAICKVTLRFQQGKSEACQVHD